MSWEGSLRVATEGPCGSAQPDRTIAAMSTEWDDEWARIKPEPPPRLPGPGHLEWAHRLDHGRSSAVEPEIALDMAVSKTAPRISRPAESWQSQASRIEERRLYSVPVPRVAPPKPVPGPVLAHQLESAKRELSNTRDRLRVAERGCYLLIEELTRWAPSQVWSMEQYVEIRQIAAALWPPR